MDPLFPGLPEDLSKATDEEISILLADHEAAIEKIKADDEEFLKGLSADEIIEQLKMGVEQVKALRAENGARVEAHENYQAEKAKLTAEVEVVAEEEPAPDEGDDDGAETEAPVVVVAEEEVVVEEEKVLVTASAEAEAPVVRLSRKPPAPAPERVPVPTGTPVGTALVATAGFRENFPEALDADSLALLQRDAIQTYGPMPHNEERGKYV